MCPSVAAFIFNNIWQGKLCRFIPVFSSTAGLDGPWVGIWTKTQKYDTDRRMNVYGRRTCIHSPPARPDPQADGVGNFPHFISSRSSLFCYSLHCHAWSELRVRVVEHIIYERRVRVRVCVRAQFIPAVRSSCVHCDIYFIFKRCSRIFRPASKVKGSWKEMKTTKEKRKWWRSFPSYTGELNARTSNHYMETSLININLSFLLIWDISTRQWKWRWRFPRLAIRKTSAGKPKQLLVTGTDP